MTTWQKAQECTLNLHFQRIRVSANTNYKSKNYRYVRNCLKSPKPKKKKKAFVLQDDFYTKLQRDLSILHYGLVP